MRTLPESAPLPRSVSAIALHATVLTLIGALSRYLADLAFRVNRTLPKDGTEVMTGVLLTKTYTVATLPAVGVAGGFIYVTDETGGATHASSDGTNWRRVSDRAIVA